MKTKLITLVLLLTGPLAFAQLPTTSSVPFLSIEPDSRVAGMGNAGVAVTDNAAAMFWNPAGLAYQTQTQISITHANWLPGFNADIFYDYLVGAYHLDGIGTIGAHVTYLNLGSQIRTDELGNELGTFSSYDVAVGASMGIPISDKLAVGGGLRFIYSNLAGGLTVGGQETRAGTAVAGDLGLLYRTGTLNVFGKEAEVRFGMNLSNMGTQIQYTDDAQSDPIPTMLRVGTAYSMSINEYNRFTIAADASKMIIRRDSTGQAEAWHQALFNSWNTLEFNNGTDDVSLSLIDQFMVGGGMEYWYNNLFALRFGYYYEHPDNGDRQYVTFGAGLRYNKFGVDFSYIAANDQSPLAETIRFSVLLNL